MTYTGSGETRFEWDPAKERINQRRHGVSFEQAAELLTDDAKALEIYDEEHSVDEDRFIAVGRTRHGVLVVVSRRWKRASFVS